MVSLERIAAARERIRLLARATPLVPVSPVRSAGPAAAPFGSSPNPAGSPLHLKCENLQPGGSFKIRGACNMLAQLDPTARSRGVITYSSGNHGQAVALAARAFDTHAVVVMPTTAPQIKIDGARSHGAEVLLAGTTSVDRRTRAEAVATERGLTMVPPFDHEWIIEGQGTIGLEILEQLPDVAAIVVPIGGGGLAAGIAAAVKQSRPGVRIIGVEPAGAASMRASLDAGQPVTLGKTSSVADGLLALRPGDLTYEHVARFVDAVVTVDEEAIVLAVLWAFSQARLVVEASGAASLAAVLSGAARNVLADGPATAVVSGGNLAPETLQAFAERASRL